MTTDWLDPLNRIILQRAFKSKAPQVRLRDGRVFWLTYMGKSVKIKPERGLVPMGTFDLNVVTSELWLESETGYTG